MSHAQCQTPTVLQGAHPTDYAAGEDSSALDLDPFESEQRAGVLSLLRNKSKLYGRPQVVAVFLAEMVPLSLLLRPRILSTSWHFASFLQVWSEKGRDRLMQGFPLRSSRPPLPFQHKPLRGLVYTLCEISRLVYKSRMGLNFWSSSHEREQE